MAEKKTKEPKKPAPEPESGAKAPPVAPPETAAKSGRNLKLILIVVGAMVVGGLVSFAAVKLFLAPKAEVAQAVPGDEFAGTVNPDETDEPIVAPTKGEAPAAGGGHAAAPAEGEAVADGPQTVTLEPFTTNINDGTGRRFLKVSLSLEVDNQAGADELKKMMPNIQDRILMLLSSQTMESISTIDGKERLRSQILREANTFMAANKIRKVNYSQFIIQ
jgi:flagellar FliL protein